MNRQDNDESYDNGKDTPPRRSKRTKLKQFDDYGEVAESRDKRSKKGSHRRRTGNDDVWPDNNE
jgi:hypothetical protein